MLLVAVVIFVEKTEGPLEESYINFVNNFFDRNGDNFIEATAQRCYQKLVPQYYIISVSGADLILKS